MPLECRSGLELFAETEGTLDRAPESFDTLGRLEDEVFRMATYMRKRNLGLTANEAAIEARALGIPALALFPYTEVKDRTPGGEEAVNSGSLMCRTARAIKDAVPEIGLMADVALDPYTDHGHDGLMSGGEIVNDA